VNRLTENLPGKGAVYNSARGGRQVGKLSPFWPCGLSKENRLGSAPNVTLTIVYTTASVPLRKGPQTAAASIKFASLGKTNRNDPQ
jgi:hypothetical protein